MAKKKRLTYKERMIKALESLPSPIKDTKHRINIYFVNDRARSNESRFEHISLERHDLTLGDIKRIPSHINQSTLKKDADRKDTYNLYLKRNTYGNEYIKISLEINFKESNDAYVKTLFITTNTK